MARQVYVAVVIFGVALLISTANAQLQPPSSQGDQSPDRVVVTAMAPVPPVGPGAPYFGSRDLDTVSREASKKLVESKAELEKCYPSRENPPAKCRPSGSDGIPGLLACETEYSQKLMNLAGKAATATKAAEDARVAAAAGWGGSDLLESTELARQQAVAAMLEARQKLQDARADTAVWQAAVLSSPPIYIDRFSTPDEIRSAQRTLDRVADKIAASQNARKSRKSGVIELATTLPDGLTIENISAQIAAGSIGGVAVVSGQFVNKGKATSGAKLLVAHLFDGNGWLLDSVPVASNGNSNIATSETRPFRLELRPVPLATKRIQLAFGSERDFPPRLSADVFCLR